MKKFLNDIRVAENAIPLDKQSYKHCADRDRRKSV